MSDFGLDVRIRRKGNKERDAWLRVGLFFVKGLDEVCEGGRKCKGT